MVMYSKGEMDVCRDKNKVDMQREAQGIVHEAPEAQKASWMIWFWFFSPH